MRAEWLQTIIPTTEAEFYFCGPVAFMKHINATLTDLGVKQEHIHYEFSVQQQAYNRWSLKQKRGIISPRFLFVLAIIDLPFRGVYR